MNNNMHDLTDQRENSNLDTLKEFALVAVFLTVIIFSVWVFLA
jgi:hypothetical protein